MNPILSLLNVSCGYDKEDVVKNISLQIQAGEVVSILGPNGVGKTTLFLTILGILQTRSGKIEILEKDISRLSYRNKARLIGYVPQEHKPSFPYSVFDVIQMGRTPYRNPFSFSSGSDEMILKEIMTSLRINHLRSRKYTQLSGGERQLVLIARSLAQQPRILMMDEPTSNLDFGNQVLVINRIKELARQGMTIIMTTHSPNQALLCSDRVVLIQPGYRYQIGKSEEVINETNLQETYGVPVKMLSYQESPNHLIQTCIPILEEDSPLTIQPGI
jgi:iron complex transport system ATP-binding protein